MLSSTCFSAGMWNLIDGVTSHSWSLQTTWSCHLNFSNRGCPKWRQKLYIWEGETTMNCIQAWLQLYWTPRNRFKKNNQKRDRPGHRISNLMGACTKCSNHLCNHRFSKWRWKKQPSLCCSFWTWTMVNKKYVSNIFPTFSQPTDHQILSNRSQFCAPGNGPERCSHPWPISTPTSPGEMTQEWMAVGEKAAKWMEKTWKNQPSPSNPSDSMMIWLEFDHESSIN